MATTVLVEHDGPVTVVTINRPHRRNAIDPATATALLDALTDFDGDDASAVAVLTGAAGSFCSGADLQAVAHRDFYRLAEDGPGPLGPTRLELSKPVIAAVEGHAVAGGLELAIWCDLRVAATDATFGVYSRRFGVPLIDGGTVRLPRLIGHGRALDLILTGRAVGAVEALAMGLVSRVVGPGRARAEAVAWGYQLAALPQACLRNDRLSVLAQWGRSTADALSVEYGYGMESLGSPDSRTGPAAFVSGAGRGGTRVEDATSAPRPGPRA
jgi:enoyl-CoA hydratase